MRNNNVTPLLAGIRRERKRLQNKVAKHGDSYGEKAQLIAGYDRLEEMLVGLREIQKQQKKLVRLLDKT